MGFIKPPKTNIPAAATGAQVRALSEDAAKGGPISKAFAADPVAWMNAAGFRYYETEEEYAKTDGKDIPATFKITPVFDTQDMIHVRVPWHEDFLAATESQAGDDYGDKPNIFIAKYFARRCR